MRLRATLLTAAVVLGSAAVAPGAGASGPTAGAIAFQATASLSGFPCGSGCSGPIGGAGSLSFSGVDGGQPWNLEISNGVLSGSVATIDANLVCQGGVATGHLHLVPGVATGSAFGAYGAAPLPHPVIDAVFDADFFWERLSFGSRMTFSNASLTLTVDPTGAPLPFAVTVMRFGTGAGGASFVPSGTGWALPCALGGTGPPTAALVDGAGTIIAT